MNKAVLVIDMPEKCSECQLLLQVPQKNLCLCLGRNDNEQIRYNPEHKVSWRPDWCPLHPVPEKDTSSPEGDYSIGIKKGWNLCVDEILIGNSATPGKK